MRIFVVSEGVIRYHAINENRLRAHAKERRSESNNGALSLSLSLSRVLNNVMVTPSCDPIE